jgi:hypothetical protein
VCLQGLHDALILCGGDAYLLRVWYSDLLHATLACSVIDLMEANASLARQNLRVHAAAYFISYCDTILAAGLGAQMELHVESELRHT